LLWRSARARPGRLPLGRVRLQRMRSITGPIGEFGLDVHQELGAPMPRLGRALFPRNGLGEKGLPSLFVVAQRLRLVAQPIVDGS